MDDLQRLVIVADLRSLRARYWRYLDTQRWEAFASLFSDDCEFTAPMDGFVLTGGRAIAAGSAERSRGATSRISVHQGMHHEIDVVDDSHARGIWGMQDYLIYPSGARHGDEAAETATLRGYGYYIDEYTKIDGVWLFSRVELFRLHREVISRAKSETPDALRR